MLPECAIRLRNAVVNGQSAEETKLFSDDEIIVVNNHKHDCFSPDPNLFLFRIKTILSIVL